MYSAHLYTHNAGCTDQGSPASESPSSICVPGTPTQGRTFVIYTHAQVSPCKERETVLKRETGKE